MSLSSRLPPPLRPSPLRIPMRLIRGVTNPLPPVVARAATAAASATPLLAPGRAGRPPLVARAAVRLAFTGLAGLAGFAAGALAPLAGGAVLAVAAAALPLPGSLFPALAALLLLSGVAAALALALARAAAAAAALVGALVVVAVAPGALFASAVAAAAAGLGALLVGLAARSGVRAVGAGVGGCGVLGWWHGAVLPVAGSVGAVGAAATHCDRRWRALCWRAPLCWRRRILVQDVVDGPQRVWIALCSIVAESGACRWPSSATRRWQ